MDLNTMRKVVFSMILQWAVAMVVGADKKSDSDSEIRNIGRREIGGEGQSTQVVIFAVFGAAFGILGMVSSLWMACRYVRKTYNLRNNHSNVQIGDQALINDDESFKV